MAQDNRESNEQRRCLNIVLRQYAYWRDSGMPDELGDMEQSTLTGIQMGAIGACANIMAEILGLTVMGETVGDTSAVGEAGGFPTVGNGPIKVDMTRQEAAAVTATLRIFGTMRRSGMEMPMPAGAPEYRLWETHTPLDDEQIESLCARIAKEVMSCE